MSCIRKILWFCACAVLCLSPMFLAGVDFFPEEECYFYLEKSNSSAPVIEKGEKWKLLFAPYTGESIRLDGDAIDEVLSRFEASVLFLEKTDGMVHYYCYAPSLGGGLVLKGYTVNLEIASDGENTSVGIPLLFGSY